MTEEKKPRSIRLFYGGPNDFWYGWVSVFQLAEWLDIQPALSCGALTETQSKWEYMAEVQSLITHGSGAFYDQIDWDLRGDDIMVFLDVKLDVVAIGIKSDNNGTVWMITQDNPALVPCDYDGEWEFVGEHKIPDRCWRGKTSENSRMG